MPMVPKACTHSCTRSTLRKPLKKSNIVRSKRGSVTVILTTSAKKSEASEVEAAVIQEAVENLMITKDAQHATQDHRLLGNEVRPVIAVLRPAVISIPTFLRAEAAVDQKSGGVGRRLSGDQIRTLDHPPEPHHAEDITTATLLHHADADIA